MTIKSRAGLSCRLVDAGSASQLRAGSAEHRPDAVLRHADDAADLLIGFAFEVIHPHDGGFGALQLAEQPTDFFVVADPLLGLSSSAAV